MKCVCKTTCKAKFIKPILNNTLCNIGVTSKLLPCSQEVFKNFPALQAKLHCSHESGKMKRGRHCTGEEKKNEMQQHDDKVKIKHQCEMSFLHKKPLFNERGYTHQGRNLQLDQAKTIERKK